MRLGFLGFFIFQSHRFITASQLTSTGLYCFNYISTDFTMINLIHSVDGNHILSPLSRKTAKPSHSNKQKNPQSTSSHYLGLCCRRIQLFHFQQPQLEFESFLASEASCAWQPCFCVFLKPIEWAEKNESTIPGPYYRPSKDTIRVRVFADNREAPFIPILRHTFQIASIFKMKCHFLSERIRRNSWTIDKTIAGF